MPQPLPDSSTPFAPLSVVAENPTADHSISVTAENGVDDATDSVRKAIPIDSSDSDKHPKLKLCSKPISDFKHEPNYNSNPFKGMYIEGQYDHSGGTTTIQFLIDSGSSDSLLDIECYNKMPDK